MTVNEAAIGDWSFPASFTTLTDQQKNSNMEISDVEDHRSYYWGEYEI